MQKLSFELVWWIPGHRGVLRNEIADEIAKKATGSRWVIKMKKTKRVFKSLLKEQEEASMVDIWNQLESRYIRVFLPSLHDLRKFMKFSLSVALCQIVSGHSRLNDYIRNKLGLINSALCCECRKGKETVTHYLFECELYEKLKKEIWLVLQAEYSFITQGVGKLQEFVFRTERFKGSSVKRQNESRNVHM